MWLQKGYIFIRLLLLDFLQARPGCFCFVYLTVELGHHILEPHVLSNQSRHFLLQTGNVIAANEHLLLLIVTGLLMLHHELRQRILRQHVGWRHVKLGLLVLKSRSTSRSSTNSTSSTSSTSVARTTRTTKSYEV